MPLMQVDTKQKFFSYFVIYPENVFKYLFQFQEKIFQISATNRL